MRLYDVCPIYLPQNQPSSLSTQDQCSGSMVMAGKCKSGNFLLEGHNDLLVSSILIIYMNNTLVRLSGEDVVRAEG